MRAFCLLGIVVLAAWAAFAEGPCDEEFTYALYVSQGFVTLKAGTASIGVTGKDGGYEATFTLKAAAFVEAIFHVDVRITTLLTPELKPIRFEKHAEEGSYVYDELSAFSYPPEGGCVVSARRTFPDGRVESRTIKRSEPVYDLMSLFFHARRLDFSHLQPGARLTVPVVSGVKVWDKTLVYKGEEEVEIADGAKVRAGVFVLFAKDGKESARFAFSREGGRVPQRLDVVLNFGSGSARLCPAVP